MKTNYILQILVLFFYVFTASAQQGINYKSIIHDANGNELANTSIIVQFTILESGTTNVFQESHSSSTDANGILIVNIGEGTPISGDFNTIDWGSTPHFLKTEIDSGDGLSDMGTTEFKTVPYALHAKTVASSVDIIFINALQRGDKVKTTGGIVGKITDVREDYVMMEIADNLIIEVEKMAIRAITY